MIRFRGGEHRGGVSGVSPRRLAPFLFCLIATGVGAVLLAAGAWAPAKAALAEMLLERAWTRTLAGEPQARPWPWADTWPVALVEAPRIGAREIVLAEAGGEAMAFGPMRLSQTPEPGAPGVSVMSAHRETYFVFLEDLVAGDQVRVTTPDGVARRFVVTGGEVVRHDRSGIEPYSTLGGGTPRIALVTCWPFHAKTPGPLRYVVWAELADDAA